MLGYLSNALLVLRSTLGYASCIVPASWLQVPTRIPVCLLMAAVAEKPWHGLTRCKVPCADGACLALAARDCHGCQPAHAKQCFVVLRLRQSQSSCLWLSPCMPHTAPVAVHR